VNTPLMLVERIRARSDLGRSHGGMTEQDSPTWRHFDR
jgi:hypothetical protein